MPLLLALFAVGVGGGLAVRGYRRTKAARALAAGAAAAEKAKIAAKKDAAVQSEQDTQDAAETLAAGVPLQPQVLASLTPKQLTMAVSQAQAIQTANSLQELREGAAATRVRVIRNL